MEKAFAEIDANPPAMAEPPVAVAAAVAPAPAPAPAPASPSSPPIRDFGNPRHNDSHVVGGYAAVDANDDTFELLTPPPPQQQSATQMDEEERIAGVAIAGFMEKDASIVGGQKGENFEGHDDDCDARGVDPEAQGSKSVQKLPPPRVLANVGDAGSLVLNIPKRAGASSGGAAIDESREPSCLADRRAVDTGSGDTGATPTASRSVTSLEERLAAISARSALSRGLTTPAAGARAGTAAARFEDGDWGRSPARYREFSSHGARTATAFEKESMFLASQM